MENTKSKKDPLNKLREIIREEVRKAIKLEMVPLLLEVIKSVNAKPLVESKNLTHGKLTNTEPINSTANPYVKTLKPKNNVNALLEETKREMMHSAGFDITDYKLEDNNLPVLIEQNQSFSDNNKPILQEQNQSFSDSSDIDIMLKSARKGSQEEFVEINQVPDYTAIMNKILNK